MSGLSRRGWHPARCPAASRSHCSFPSPSELSAFAFCAVSDLSGFSAAVCRKIGRHQSIAGSWRHLVFSNRAENPGSPMLWCCSPRASPMAVGRRARLGWEAAECHSPAWLLGAVHRRVSTTPANRSFPWLLYLLLGVRICLGLARTASRARACSSLVQAGSARDGA